MTVLDIGAHHGLYTLIASRRVGRHGAVVAFEPSPRERRKLTRHLRLNGCSNVHVESYALSDGGKSGILHIVLGRETGLNSLRPPNVEEDTETVRVQKISLDDYLGEKGINRVHFMKVDAEGGELDIFKGATHFLQREPRPVILCEVADIRTHTWGYNSDDLLRYLEDSGFRWFSLSTRGLLRPMSERTSYERNCVAMPVERLSSERSTDSDTDHGSRRRGADLKAKAKRSWGKAEISTRRGAGRIPAREPKDTFPTPNGTSLLSLFAIPKPFKGHVGVIQRNAIMSWTLLDPRPEIILLGDEEGTAELSRELELIHVPGVATNEFGTPLISDLFRRANESAESPILCYANADILFMDGLTSVAERVGGWRDRFLVAGKVWDVRVNDTLEFGSGWKEDLDREIRRRGRQRGPWAMDYFIFPHGLFKELPPFAVGRPGWDNWLVWVARKRRIPVADASQAVLAIHQNHDYRHVLGGDNRPGTGPEADRNRELIGSWRRLYTIDHSSHRVSSDGIAYNLSGSRLSALGQTARRGLIDVTRPIRQVVGVRSQGRERP